jgi:hypothetical protein
VMLVKQADAINTRYNDMKNEIDSLKKEIKTLKNKSNCDSLLDVFQDMADGPTFIYNYKNDIHTLDLSLYKISLNTSGKIKMKKMNRWEIGRYFEIMRGDDNNNLIDWKNEFREYNLPLVDKNKQLAP